MHSHISDIEVFVAVIAEGSFSAAARRLNRTPSAVSKQVARLEEQLGTRLLNRTTRQVALTAEGNFFYERVRPVLEDLRDIEGEMSQMGQKPTGTLRITCATSFGEEVLMPLMPRFMDLYPALDVELHMTDMLIDLTERGFDIGIRLTANPPMSLVARRLAPNRRIVCASPAYLLRHGTPASPNDLADHKCIMFSTHKDFQTWPFETTEGPIEVEVNGQFYTNTGEGLKRAVLAGVGISRLAAFNAGDEVVNGKIVPILTDFERDDGSSVFICYHPERRNLPKIRAFVDFLMDTAPERMPWLQDPDWFTRNAISSKE